MCHKCEYTRNHGIPFCLEHYFYFFLQIHRFLRDVYVRQCDECYRFYLSNSTSHHKLLFHVCRYVAARDEICHKCGCFMRSVHECRDVPMKGPVYDTFHTPRQFACLGEDHIGSTPHGRKRLMEIDSSPIELPPIKRIKKMHLTVVSDEEYIVTEPQMKIMIENELNKQPNHRYPAGPRTKITPGIRFKGEISKQQMHALILDAFNDLETLRGLIFQTSDINFNKFLTLLRQNTKLFLLPMRYQVDKIKNLPYSDKMVYRIEAFEKTVYKEMWTRTEPQWNSETHTPSQTTGTSMDLSYVFDVIKNFIDSSITTSLAATRHFLAYFDSEEIITLKGIAAKSFAVLITSYALYILNKRGIEGKAGVVELILGALFGFAFGHSITTLIIDCAKAVKDIYLELEWTRNRETGEITPINSREASVMNRDIANAELNMKANNFQDQINFFKARATQESDNVMYDVKTKRDDGRFMSERELDLEFLSEHKALPWQNPKMSSYPRSTYEIPYLRNDGREISDKDLDEEAMLCKYNSPDLSTPPPDFETIVTQPQSKEVQSEMLNVGLLEKMNTLYTGSIGNKNFTNFANSCANMSKIMQFTTNAPEYFANIISQLTNTIRYYINGYAPTPEDAMLRLDRDLPIFAKKFSAWIHNPPRGASKMNLDCTNYEIHTYIELDHMYTLITARLTTLKSRGNISSLNHYMVYVRKVLDEAKSRLVGALTTKPLKIEPVVVYMQGAPGVGKSYTINKLIASVYAALNEDYDETIDCFTKAVTTTYYDGYCSQKAVLFDDFLQTSDPTLRAASVATFIDISTTASMHLDMSSVIDKKSTYFNSEIIALTSNSKLNGLGLKTLIACEEAFNRRIDIVIEVTNLKPKPEDLVTGFNKDLFKADVTFTRSNIVFADCDYDGVFSVMLDVLRSKREMTRARMETKGKVIGNYKPMIGLQAAFPRRVQPQMLTVIDDTVKQNFFMALATILTVFTMRSVNKIVDILQNTLDLITAFTFNMFGLVTAQVERFIALPAMCYTGYFIGLFAKFGYTLFLGIIILFLLLGYFFAQIIKLLVYLITAIFKPINEYISSIFYPKRREVVPEGGGGVSASGSSPKPPPKNTPSVSRNSKVTSRSSSNRYTGYSSHGSDHGHSLIYGPSTHSSDGLGYLSSYGGYSSGSEPHSRQTIPESILTQIFCENCHNKVYQLFEDDNVLCADCTDCKFVSTVCKKCETTFNKVENDLVSDLCLKCRVRNVASEYIQDSSDITHFPAGKINIKQCDTCPNTFTLALTNTNQTKCKLCRDNPKRQVKFEQSIDVGATDLIEKLHENIGTLEITGTICAKQKVLFLEGSLFVTSSHAFSDPNWSYRVSSPKSNAVEINYKDVVLLPHRDLAFGFIRGFPQHRKISHMFYDAKECFDLIGDSSCIMYVDVMDGKRKYIYGQIKGEEWIHQDGTDRKCHALAISASTESGTCGSPYVLLNNQVNKKLLGIHIAGNLSTDTTTMAYCARLSPDLIAHVKTKLPGYITTVKVQSHVEPSNIYITSDDDIEHNGQVPPALFQQPHGLPTALRFNNAFHLPWEPLCAPADNSLEALRIGVTQGFGKSTYNVPNSMREAVIDDLHRYWENKESFYSTPAQRRIWTYDESVNGIQVHGSDTYAPYAYRMNPWTSPGFIYCTDQMKTGRGKGSLFEHLEGKSSFKLEPSVMQNVIYRENCARKGISLPHFWRDSLKDETRPKAKVQAHSTRVFSLGMLDFNILLRRYFGAFVCHTQCNHINGEISIGINMLNTDSSHPFYLYHFNGKDWFIAIDMAKWDKNLPGYAFFDFCETVNRWYNDGPENAMIRRSLMTTLLYSHRVCGLDIYTPAKGVPSGSYLTAPFNSGANQVLSRHAYIGTYVTDVDTKTTHEQLYWKLYIYGQAETFRDALQSYSDNVSAVFYGDDAVLAVSRFCTFFNMQTYALMLKLLFGMTATHPNKSTNVMEMKEKYMLLPEITYLKRTPKLLDGKWHFQLDMDTIKEVMFWTRGRASQLVVQSSFECVATEMTRYTEEEYEYILNSIIKGTNRYVLHKEPYAALKRKIERCDFMDILAGEPVMRPILGLPCEVC